MIKVEELKTLTVVKLKDLAKKHNIKGISNKKKDDLVNYLFSEINAQQQRQNLDNIVDNVFHKIESGDDEGADKLIDNYVNDITQDSEDILEDNNNHNVNDITDKIEDISIGNVPKYYYHKFDYMNKKFDIKSIESLLNVKLNYGDIVQFDDYRANGCYIVNETDFEPCSGYVSDDIFIKLKFSEKLQDPIKAYKNIHNDFYGIELQKDNKYITVKFGIFDAPNNWKYYYVNQDIFEDEIHIDIGLDNTIQLCFNIDKSNQYISYINSIKYVKKLYEIHNSDSESYGLYLTLHNNDDDNLTKEESDFVYNINIPDYCTINVEFQCIYYEIRFNYFRKDKENMIKFINEYYFSKEIDFVKEIEPIIDE